MSESIVDLDGVAQLPPSVLDIHRDFPSQAVDSPVISVDAAKITSKVTPDKTFTAAEKRQWKREQDRQMDAWERAARSIVLDYVNADLYGSFVADGLEPFSATAAANDERETRRGLFRSFLKCLRKNGHAPVDLVLYDDESVGVSGVWRCGSLWQCPRCSAAGLWRYSRRICSLLEAVQKTNRMRALEGLPSMSVLFATFTIPHSAGEPLDKQMDLFSRVWSSVLDAKAVRSLAQEFGLVGHVRCFDHTVSFRDGLTDWHSHFHNLMFFDPLEAGACGVALVDGSVEAASVEGTLFDVWANRVSKYGGGRVCSREAFCVELVDLVSEERSDSAIADYAAKVFTLPGYMTKSQKRRRGEEVEPGAPWRSLSPFDLLDSYLEYGSAYDYAGAWIEYCIGTKGKHRVQFSKGLEQRLGVAVEKVEKEAQPVCRHTLPGPVADVALKQSDVLADLKEAVLADDAVVFFDVLEPLGLSWAADDVAQREELKPRVLSEAELARARFRQERGLDIADLLEGWEGVGVSGAVDADLSPVAPSSSLSGLKYDGYLFSLEDNNG